MPKKVPKNDLQTDQPYLYFEADNELDKFIWLDYETHTNVPFDELTEEQFYGPIVIWLPKAGYIDFYICKNDWK